MLPSIKVIEDRDLRRRVEEVWEVLWDQSEWEDVMDVPTSPEITASNVNHVRAVVRMALALADVLEECHGMQLDRDRLVAAGLLMDAGKMVEYRPDGQGGYELTEVGRAYPHAFLVAHEGLKRGVPAEILNIVLMHSPRRSQFPSSTEGQILYYADMIDVLAYLDHPWTKRLFLESGFQPIVGRSSLGST